MNEKNTFRAWDPNRKLMYDKVELYADGTIRTAYNSKKVGNHTDLLDLALRTKKDECIILQCTGFRDYEGTLIFLGDTVFDLVQKYTITVGEITVARWIVEEDRMNQPMKSIKVIGNKYE